MSHSRPPRRTSTVTFLLAALDLPGTSARTHYRLHAPPGLLEDSHLIVAHAFDALRKSKLALADVPKERICAYVEEEQEHKL